MKYKVGDSVRVKPDLDRSYSVLTCSVTTDMMRMKGKIYNIAEISENGNYKLCTDDDYWYFTAEMLEPVCKYKVGDKVRVLDGSGIYNYLGSRIGEMRNYIGDIVTIESVECRSDGSVGYWVKENEYFFDERGLEPVHADGDFCTGFKGGKIPTPEKPVTIEETMEYYRQQLISNCGVPPMFFSNRSSGKRAALDALVDSYSKLGCTSFLMSRNEIEKIIKEDNPMKFTFYVTEGTRVDKSCNGTIPTMTTTVEANSYSRTTPVGTATCDKADYDMRQGVLEALANMYCDGDFDKVYNKAVKRNELADKKKRTCKYCGKVFDTVEEREAEEAWHVERKKARRERYLLRKRAKEIAFEEQAQKMAKEMIEEDK